MKTVYFFFIFSAGLLFLGFSGGPGNTQGTDRTGGPLAEGFCGSCHASGAFNPSIDLILLKDGQETTQYEAGMTYTMRVTVNADAGAQVYGFQAVALSGANDNQAGAFTAGTGTHTAVIAGRQYIEHSAPNANNVFEVEWTAPATGAGDVRFYAAANSANGDGSNGGDGAVFLTQPKVLTDMTVSTQDFPEFAEGLKVFPNPVQSNLNLQIELNESRNGIVNILNTAGQVVLTRNRFFHEGLNEVTFDMSAFPAGQYWLEIGDREGQSRTAIFKK